MSVFKDTIKYINNLPYDVTFDHIMIYDFIHKNNKNVINIPNILEKYITDLECANFIKVDYIMPISSSMTIAMRIRYIRKIYIKNINIPDADTLPVNKLKKLAEDETFRTNYFRKLKLKEIKR